MQTSHASLIPFAFRARLLKSSGLWGFVILSLLALCLSGCASDIPVRYANLSSTAQLQANAGDQADRIPYRYSSAVDWRHYTGAIVEPVVIYQGTDNQFGDMAQGDREKLAQYMQEKFTQALQTRFRPATAPGNGTLRIKLTLAGASTTTPVLGTFTKVDIGGGLYNIVQSARGKEGMLNGSVYYAVEIYDAPTGRLLYSYVAKQYPNAMNIGASIGALSAAKTGIEKGAQELVTLLK